MLDNIKVENYERSLFMIKPDSYIYKKQILEELIKSDFQLEYVKEVILNKEFLAQLYSSETDEIIKMLNIEYFSGKLATIGIAAGKNAKERLLKKCGEIYDPNMCDKDTIRYKYSGIRKPIILNGYPFYINAIHRSLPQDSEKEIEIYMTEYILKNRESGAFDGR